MTTPIHPDHLLAPAEYDAVFRVSAAQWTTTAPGVHFLLGLGAGLQENNPDDIQAA